MYRKNAWNKYKDNLSTVYDFAKDYMNYLSYSKTERLATAEAVKLLEEKGFVNFDTVTSLSTGDKIYVVNKNKNVLAFIIGNKPLTAGLRILGAHIDSPRLDLKAKPIYENNELCLLDTHYYGGIKKYQWTTIPLAIHGVVALKDGTK